MAPEQLFNISGNLAMAGWLFLIFVSPFWKNINQVVVAIFVTILALFYAWMILQSFQFSDLAKFGTLEGVMGLFTNKTMVCAGWIHYLAFDLFIGAWIVRNAQKHSINHWITVPSLLLTFMMGPIGLLSYFLIRFALTKTYFAEN